MPRATVDLKQKQNERVSGGLAAAELGELRRRLRDFNDDYIAVLDAGDLESWPAFFTEDCTYKAMLAENYALNLPIGIIDCDGIGMVKDRVTALRTSSEHEDRRLRHVISGLWVKDLAEGAIHAEANFVVFEALSYREPTLFAMGRYIDEIVEDGEGFLFRKRIAVIDNYHIRTSLVFPL